MEKRSSSVSTVLSLTWQGVTEGIYPNGTRFDYNTAFEAYVIEKALEEEGIESLTTNQIRNSFQLIPIVPSSVTLLIQEGLENGEQISYYPTDFKIVLDNAALDLSVDESRDLINEMIDQFRIDFENRYIQQSVILNYTGTDFELYDYLDIHKVLETQIDLIESVMITKGKLNPGFVSPTLGIGFADILVRTSLVSQLEIEKIESRTATYLLTKDKDYLITNYTHQNDIKQLELDKTLANVINAQLMIDNYTGSVTTIIIPGMDPSIEIDTYYNTLIDNLVNLQMNVNELENDIIYNELQIDRLNGDDPLFTVTPAKQAEEIAKLEAAIARSEIELSSIIEDSNTMLVEYDTYTTSSVIKPLMTPEYESSVSTLMYTGIGLILGAGIGVVVVLFKHDWE